MNNTVLFIPHKMKNLCEYRTIPTYQMTNNTLIVIDFDLCMNPYSSRHSKFVKYKLLGLSNPILLFFLKKYCANVRPIVDWAMLHLQISNT